MRFIIWERSVQKKTDFWIVLCCILKEPKINMLEFSCWCKKIPNLSMKNYTQFHSFSLIKRVKYEMISPFSRNEKWKIFSLHSFREVKVKIKWLKIEIEKWKWKSNDSKSRSRSEFSKKISRILENRDSRWSLSQRTRNVLSKCQMRCKIVVGIITGPSPFLDVTTDVWDTPPHCRKQIFPFS